MGHGFETALIDTIVRFQRLRGRNVLCLPGTDHASIAVQTILEKQLQASRASRKEDLGRDAFLERAWSWKAQSGGTIVGQLRRLGYSVDWSRERFTLDPGLSAAVAEAFVRLHEQGLIYRGEYLVNWCPASGSAVSDLEVEMKEMEGHLWHFRYPLSGGPGRRRHRPPGGGHHPPRDDAGRHGRGRASRRSPLRRPGGPHPHPAAGGPGDSDRGRRARGSGLRNGLRQGDSRPRSERLRHRQPPRPAADHRDGQGRHDECRRRALRWPGPLRGQQGGGGGDGGRAASW